MSIESRLETSFKNAVLWALIPACVCLEGVGLQVEVIK